MDCFKISDKRTGKLLKERKTTTCQYLYTQQKATCLSGGVPQGVLDELSQAQERINALQSSINSLNTSITQKEAQIADLQTRDGELSQQIADAKALRSTPDTYGMARIAPTGLTSATDDNGLVLGAKEKNAAVNGTLANGVSKNALAVSNIESTLGGFAKSSSHQQGLSANGWYRAAQIGKGIALVFLIKYYGYTAYQDHIFLVRNNTYHAFIEKLGGGSVVSTITSVRLIKHNNDACFEFYYSKDVGNPVFVSMIANSAEVCRPFEISPGGEVLQELTL